MERLDDSSESYSSGGGGGGGFGDGNASHPSVSRTASSVSSMSVSTTICALAENVLNNFFVLWREETVKIIDHFANETEEDVTLIVESALGDAQQAKIARGPALPNSTSGTSNPAATATTTSSNSSSSSSSVPNSTSSASATASSSLIVTSPGEHQSLMTQSQLAAANSSAQGMADRFAQQCQQATGESPPSDLAIAASAIQSQFPSVLSSEHGDSLAGIGSSLAQRDIPITAGASTTINTMSSGTSDATASTSLIKTPQAYEQFLYSFATVAKHCVDAVIDALCDWRANLDCYPPHHIRIKIEESSRLSNRRSSHKQEALIQVFSERKQVAADYMFLRILLLMLGRHSEPLSQTVASQLEQVAITHFINADKQLQTGIPSLLESKKKVLDMLAEMVGFLSVYRFQSLADKFLRNIESRLTSNSSKMEACHFVRGMRFMRLQISKPESLAETTQFLRRVLELFKRSKKKTELKVAFCESISSMLSPLVAFEYKDSSEYRDWFSLLRDSHIYALKQQKKSKYVNCSHQLISTILCASSKQYFLDNFWPHIESLFKLFKVASTRLIATDCIVHVIGFYLTIVAEMENPDERQTVISASAASSNVSSSPAATIGPITQSSPLLSPKHQSVASIGSSSASPTTVNRKEVIERLQKVATAFCSAGRKSSPNPENELLYDAMVDVIVVIANRKLDFAMNGIIMELLCGDSPLTENTYIGMKAFMAIADQADVHRLSPLLDDPSKSTALQLWPEWALNILDKHAVRPQHSPTSSTDDEDWASKSAWNAVRIKSPFSSFGRADAHNIFQRGPSAWGHSFRHSPADLFSEHLGITPYETGLSRLFSNILTHCDSKYGQLLLPSQFVLLSEMQPKDKALGLHVFEMAIRCISRLLPCECSAQNFAELLCRCSIHQHEGIRQVACESIFHLMEFRPELRAEIVHAFVDLVSMLSDFRMDIRENVVGMLVSLLHQWEQVVSLKDRVSPFMSEELSGPTIYGNLKPGDQSVFEPARVEGCALMLLCSIKASNRKMALQMVSAVRGIVAALRAQLEEAANAAPDRLTIEQDTTHDRIPSDVDLQSSGLIANAAAPAFSGTLTTTTLLDEVLQQASADIMQKALKSSLCSQAKTPQAVPPSGTTFSFLLEQESNEWQSCWSECLREIGRLSSELCPMSAHYCIGMLVARLVQLRDILAKTPTTPNVIEMWRNYISFFCSVSVLDEGPFGDSFTTEDRTRRRTSRETPRRSLAPDGSMGGTGFYPSHSAATPKNILDGVVPFIQNSMETISAIAVRALGCAHIELVEFIMAHLQSIEDEAGLHTEKDKPKGKKRRDFIRSQITRVVALALEGISPTILVDRVRIRSRFVEFVRQQLAYLSLPTNLLDVSLQQLRLDLFVIVDNLACKLHAAFPLSVAQPVATVVVSPATAVSTSNHHSSASVSPPSSPASLSGTDISTVSASNVTLSTVAPSPTPLSAAVTSASSATHFLTLEDRIKLICFIIPWTNAHPSSSEWFAEEAASLEALVEKIKDPDEVRSTREEFRHRCDLIAPKACDAISALLLAPGFFGTDSDAIATVRRWSMENLLASASSGGTGMQSAVSSTGGSLGPGPTARLRKKLLHQRMITSVITNLTTPRQQQTTESGGSDVSGTTGSGAPLPEVVTSPVSSASSLTTLTTTTPDQQNSSASAPPLQSQPSMTSIPPLRTSSSFVMRHTPSSFLGITAAPAISQREVLKLESPTLTVLSWINQVLCSESPAVRASGCEAIRHLFSTHPHMSQVLIDQCYNKNALISRGYFSALVDVYSMRHHSLQMTSDASAAQFVTDVAIMLCLFLFMSLDLDEETRNRAFTLLHLINEEFFSQKPLVTDSDTTSAPSLDEETGNCPFVISSTSKFLFSRTQEQISKKLAHSHQDMSLPLLLEVRRRLPFMSDERQTMMLRSVVPWVEFLPLDEDISAVTDHHQQHYFLRRLDLLKNGDRPALVDGTGASETESAILTLFYLTMVYGDKAVKSCSKLWAKLAEDKQNIKIIIGYLVAQGTRFLQEEAEGLFSVLRQISLYLMTRSSSAQYAVDLLIREIQIARERNSLPIENQQQSKGSGTELSGKPAALASRSRMTMGRSTRKSRTRQPQGAADPDSGFVHLDRADVVLILLTDSAYNNELSYLNHLPVILHYLFLKMDHKSPLVFEQAKTLLCNIIHTFVIKKLSHQSHVADTVEKLNAASMLIEHIRKHKRASLWQRDVLSSYNVVSVEQPQHFLCGYYNKNVEEMTSLLKRVVNVLDGKVDYVRQRWSDEALIWATRTASVHNVLRSFQLFRSLSPNLNSSKITEILESLLLYLKELPNPAKISVVIEIINTLRVLVSAMESSKLAMFPQLFWASIFLLYSDVQAVYIYSLQLLTEIIEKLDFSSSSVQSSLVALIPQNPMGISQQQQQQQLQLPVFVGIQPLVLRGLMDPISEPIAINLLTKLTLFPCESIVDPLSSSRLLMNILGLLPWLCLHVNEKDRKHRCFVATKNLGEACEMNGLKKISKVFLRYSKGHYDTQEKFLLDLRHPMSEVFPQHEQDVFDFLEKLLEHGPNEYQIPVLSILHSFLLHIADMNASTVPQRERLMQMVVARLFSDEERRNPKTDDAVRKQSRTGGQTSSSNTPEKRSYLWQEATKVLDVAVQSSSKGMRDRVIIGDGNKDIPISIVSGSASVRASQHPNLIQPIRPRPEFVEKPGDKTVHIISALERLLSTSGDRRKMAVPSGNDGALPSTPIASLPTTPAWPLGENTHPNARSVGPDVSARKKPLHHETETINAAASTERRAEAEAEDVVDSMSDGSDFTDYGSFTDESETQDNTPLIAAASPMIVVTNNSPANTVSSSRSPPQAVTDLQFEYVENSRSAPNTAEDEDDMVAQFEQELNNELEQLKVNGGDHNPYLDY